MFYALFGVAVHVFRYFGKQKLLSASQPNSIVSWKHLAQEVGCLNAWSPADLVLVQFGCHFLSVRANFVL